MTLISLKIDPEKLERIDAEAKRLGITRTALLLKPWTNTFIPVAKVQEWTRPSHAQDCKCLICKPPKN